MPEENKPPDKSTSLQLASMIIGALGGLSLLAFIVISKHYGVTLSEMEQGGIIVSAAASFGLGMYGARQMPVKP